MDGQRRVVHGAAPAAEGAPFEEILRRRVSRRQALGVGLVLSTAAVVRPRLAVARPGRQGAEPSFKPIGPETSDRIVVPEGFRSDVLLRWGDPLDPTVPPLDLGAQDAELQGRRFGFNCDFLMFFPLPATSRNPVRGLLWVNHEYTDGLMMFPDYDPANPSREHVEVELAAHGASVVAVERGQGGWRYRVHDDRNRRLTATTPIRITGPAAGDEWLQTGTDPTGTAVLGMLNNCGGGLTPWGTVLSCEENFNQYFANQSMVADPAVAAAHARYGLPEGGSARKWERFFDRFDLTKEPHEPFRFGWVVECDPYDPGFTPVKRTALGRFKHEGATTVLSRRRRPVVYGGDDERFQCIYKFVSDGAYDPGSRENNLRLLDNGTLYAARFDEDGTGQWLPLAFGTGPLVPPAFRSQADVLIRTRDAALAVGATRMDRPEDVETNPLSGRVYLVMTNNSQRGTPGAPGPDAANPRAPNRFGHIIELIEDDRDPASTSFRCEIFLLCGDPTDPSTYFSGFDKSKVSPISNPDNLTFDSFGNMWIATDGQPDTLGANDAVHAVPTRGSSRGQVRQFLSAAFGAEVASLVLNPDEHALFVSIQHPGEGGTLAQPTSVWPDPPAGPARPSVIVVTRDSAGPVTR